MTAGDFRGFVEIGIGVSFHIFDVLFKNDFLIDRTADFHFHVSDCPAAFSPSNKCTNIYFEPVPTCGLLLYI